MCIESFKINWNSVMISISMSTSNLVTTSGNSNNYSDRSKTQKISKQQYW